MKQIKSLMTAALMLVMGIMMTSCLNSDNSESLYDWAGFVLVQNTMAGTYFQDAGGNKLIPTYESLMAVEQAGFKSSETNVAFIYVKMVEDTETSTKAGETTPQTFDVKLVAAQSLDGEDVVVAPNAEEMAGMAPETAPVGSLEFSDNTWGTTVKPMLFDLNTLLLPIQFYLTNDNEKFKLHKLYLACNMEEVSEGDTTLVFYLRHDRGEDDKAEVYYSQWYGFDIRAAVNMFAMKSGADPTKIVIKAHETQSMTTELPENYEEYEVEYTLETQN